MIKLPGKPPPLVERAFDLARSGRFAGLEALRRELRLEGYDASDIDFRGQSLRGQLLRLCQESSRLAGAESGDKRPIEGSA
jgi:hypothetical protein